MVTTVELSARNEKENSMEDHWMWYLTGLVDSIGTFGAKIRTREKLDLEYEISPIVYISRPEELEAVFGMLDEYMEENNIRYYTSETSGSNRIQISKPEDIRRFLEPLLPGMIQQRERAEILLKDLLPHFEDGGMSSKEEFIEVVGVIDEMKKYPIQNRSSKYSQSYFLDEWGWDILQ